MHTAGTFRVCEHDISQVTQDSQEGEGLDCRDNSVGQHTLKNSGRVAGSGGSDESEQREPLAKKLCREMS